MTLSTPAKPSFDGATACEIVMPPTPRPGERLLHGRVQVFNADLLKAHLAREAVASAPADLSGLTDDELSHLNLAALNGWFCDNRNGEAFAAGRAMRDRIAVERSRRGQDTMGRAIQPSKARAA